MRKLNLSHRNLIFCLCIFALFVGSSSAETKKKVTAEDIVNLKVVRDVQISPDGKLIAFAAGKRSDFDQLRESKIWLVPADGSTAPELLIQSKEDQSSPRWSPDGRSIAFLSAVPSEKGADSDVKQLYWIQLGKKKAIALTDRKGGVDSFRWAPDGKSIAFLATDPKTEQEESKEKEKDDAIFVDHNYKFSRLWKLELSDHSVRRLFPQDGSVNDFDWAPDGSRMAISISRTPLLDDLYWRSTLLIINVQTGEVVRTVDERAGVWIHVDWSPDGNSIAYSRVAPSGVAEWRMVARADGALSQQVDDDYSGTILGMNWMPDSKNWLAVSIEGTQAKLIQIDVVEKKISELASLQAPYSDFSMSDDGKTVAYVAEQWNSPANVWVWKAGSFPKQITNLQPEVHSWNVGSLREIAWRNKKDNALLYGVLITPPEFQKREHPTPMIVQVHGGPEWAWWSGWHGSWHEWGQFLASNGYVVFLPNPRGSDGQNWRWIEANIEDWGGMDYEDIMSGIESLVAEKIADPERIGIGGWSYGGFMSAWAVTHSNQFRAAIVGAGVTNLFSMSGTGDIPTFLNYYFKGTPFERRSIYDAHSPMTYLQNCKTPSLILHGDADLRVPISQGYEFYNGLKLLGRPAEMVVYPREAHGFVEQLHQQDLLKRVLAWYDRYLK